MGCKMNCFFQDVLKAVKTRVEMQLDEAQNQQAYLEGRFKTRQVVFGQAAVLGQGHPSTACIPHRSTTYPKGTLSTESLHDRRDSSQEFHQDSTLESGI